ncbi:MAG: hypothetical protein ACHQ51_08065 [Elusimicrobiota bacterium]
MKRILVRAVLIGAAALAAVTGPGLVRRWKGAAMRRRVNQSLADYRPQPYAPPPTLADFLPDQTPGDAGGVYTQAFQLNAARPSDPAPLRPEQIAAVDNAIRVKDCAILGVAYLPKSLDNDLLLHTARTAGAEIATGKYFVERGKAFETAHNPAAAEAEYRNGMAFAYHMMQDWDTPTSALGSTIMVGMVLRLQILRIARASDEFEERRRSVKLLLEMKAFMPDKKEMATIEHAARSRAELASLNRYADDPSLRRPYLSWALFQAAGWWSEEESRAAEPWPERTAFLQHAAASGDRRVAALGNAYLAILADDQQRYARLAVPEREAARRAAAARFNSLKF